ncbi:IclR family transcriptional regulator [Cupriavidus necator]|uniref:IclR family transcriptional regulator n=1 Tax=Cupriavidus necator TaxID=106590 RepID=UPI001E413A79|nr:IclR family transcriptional regulator [Cupriavidus necator]
MMISSTPLTRYHQVLQIVAERPEGVTFTQLAEATGLPRSTSHRIAGALCAIGYLEHMEDAKGTYILGPALLSLLRSTALADSRLLAFKEALQFLSAKLGETAFCARLVNDQVQLTEAVTPPPTNRSFMHPGVGPRPLGKCSSSKAILAYADPKEVERLLNIEILPGLKENVTVNSFFAQLRKVAKDGYAICDGEIEQGVYSLACPVPVGNMMGLYSLGIVGPAKRLKAMPIGDLVNIVKSAAAIASEQLLRDLA